MARMLEQADERPVTSLSAAMRPKRSPTPEEDAVIHEVRDIATEWDAGRLPLPEVRALCSGHMRWLTTRFTPPDHAAFAPLMRLLDALIADEQTAEGDLIVTKHGTFTRKALIDAEARITREDGKEMVIFPIAYPWRIRPDEERGIEGVRAPAVYRAKHERGPDYTSFRTTPTSRPKKNQDRSWLDK